MLVFELKINDGVDDKMIRLPKATTLAVRHGIKKWHREYLRRHFKHGAARKYKYAKRTPAHQKRKRAMGSPPALVMTGQSEAMLTRSFALRITNQGKGQAKGSFIVGTKMKYFWVQKSGKAKNQPDKAKEMKAFTDQEVKELADFIKNELLDIMDKTGTAKVRIIK